jgi:cell division septum initiation protein DivIVA
METSDASAIQSSTDLMSGYSFDIGPEGYDPLEVQLALCEWAGYAEDLKAQLASVQAELERARSESHAIHKQVYAGFGVKVASVMRAAKTEGEKVRLEAQRQGRACLSAAREEAGEIVAAARREAARINAQAEADGNRRAADSSTPAMPVRVRTGTDVPRFESTRETVRAANGNGAARSGSPAPLRIDSRWIDELWAGAS